MTTVKRAVKFITKNEWFKFYYKDSETPLLGYLADSYIGPNKLAMFTFDTAKFKPAWNSISINEKLLFDQITDEDLSINPTSIVNFTLGLRLIDETQMIPPPEIFTDLELIENLLDVLNSK